MKFTTHKITAVRPMKKCVSIYKFPGTLVTHQCTRCGNELYFFSRARFKKIKTAAVGMITRKACEKCNSKGQSRNP